MELNIITEFSWVSKMPIDNSISGIQVPVESFAGDSEASTATTATPRSVAAQPSPNGAKKTAVFGFAQVALIFIIFYFFLIRPQKKRVAEERRMRDALRIGDTVSTTGGMFGVVTEIDSNRGLVSLEISKGINVVLYRDSVREVLKEIPEVGSSQQVKKTKKDRDVKKLEYGTGNADSGKAQNNSTADTNSQNSEGDSQSKTPTD